MGRKIFEVIDSILRVAVPLSLVVLFATWIWFVVNL